MYVERRSRRTALVLTTIAVMMVACAKLSASGALQRSEVPDMGLNSDFRFVLEEDAAAADVADNNSTAAAPTEAAAGDDGRTGDEPGGNVVPFNPAQVGWDKSEWTGTDWAQWIVPGPVVTLVLCAFVMYMYGPMWAVGTLIVMCGVDALAFYTNA
jgi:hypothetical protein